MVAVFVYTDLEDWFFFTSPTAGTKSRYPDQTQAGDICVAVENDFIARTGKTPVKATATHMQLVRWIAEIEMRKWAKTRHYNADAASTPGGSQSWMSGSSPPSFTWEQFDKMVETIIYGDKAARIAALAGAMASAKPSTPTFSSTLQDKDS